MTSTAPGFVAGEGFELARSPDDALTKLEGMGVTEATLAGGSILNTSFAKAQLIDAVEINIESVIIGRGIPLFDIDDFDLRLDLVSARQLGDRLVQLRYVVNRS